MEAAYGLHERGKSFFRTIIQEHPTSNKSRNETVVVMPPPRIVGDYSAARSLGSQLGKQFLCILFHLEFLTFEICLLILRGKFVETG